VASFGDLLLNEKQKRPSYYFVEQQTGRLLISVFHWILAVLTQRKIVSRAEIWEQIAYVGYCDMNTTRELIERQTKYHRTKKRCAALELCQLIS